jgi:nucleotide-binding universal stress UspA family protein
MFKRILLPIDLTETELTEHAVEAATALAKAFDSDLRIVNVQSLIPIAYLDYVREDFDTEITRGLEKELAAIVDKIEIPPERISTALLFGPVYQKALAEAEAWGADVVVIGSHLPGLDRLLIGSDAAAIVGHARCSVVVVRGPEAGRS